MKGWCEKKFKNLPEKVGFWNQSNTRVLPCLIMVRSKKFDEFVELIITGKGQFTESDSFEVVDELFCDTGNVRNSEKGKLNSSLCSIKSATTGESGDPIGAP